MGINKALSWHIIGKLPIAAHEFSPHRLDSGIDRAILRKKQRTVAASRATTAFASGLPASGSFNAPSRLFPSTLFQSGPAHRALAGNAEAGGGKLGFKTSLLTGERRTTGVAIA